MRAPYGRSTVWVWGADIHCNECAEAGHLDGADCDGNEAEPFDGDSQEADSPQHCGTCGAFLENPLTDEGYAWLRAKLTETDHTVPPWQNPLPLWAEFYRLTDFTDEESKEALP